MHKHRPSFSLLASIVLLIAVGTALMSSASVVISQQNTGDPNRYFMDHLISLVIGAVFMFIGYKLDYKIWKKFAPGIIIFALLLLVLVLIPGIGIELGGAKRWITWPFLFSPTEIYKLSLIIYLAAWLEKKQGHVKNILYSTLPFVAIVSITALLILKQPDTGTFITTALVAGVMYIVGGASIPQIIVLGTVGIAGLIGYIKLEAYRMDRFMIFLNPTADSGNTGYQINQALLAIGTGGLFGLGFGHSRQKFNYLPEAASDSIFAITAEELGFLGAATLIILFLFFAIQGFRVALRAPDPFSRFLVTGIVSWVIIQAIINIFALTSLIPLTGVPLPFISMGGTSTVVLMAASGILLNISKHTEGETRENRLRRRGNRWSHLTGSGRN